jgi:hypothetical protein
VRLNAPLAFVNPDRDTLPGEAVFCVDVEALHTDKAIAIDGTQTFGASQELMQTLWLDDTPPEPTQDLHRRTVAIGSIAMLPVWGRMKGFDEGGMLILHVFSRLSLLKLTIRQAQLHFELGFNHVLPGLALLNVARLDVSVSQNREGIPSPKHAPMVGDHRLGAAVFRQGSEEDLQHSREVLLRGRHAGHNLPRIALDNTDAIDPAAIQLDQGANIGEPQVMARRGAIGQMCEADRVRLIISGTLPGAWRSVELAIDGHRSPHRSRTRGRPLALLPK